MEKASEDKVLFSIIFILGALILLAAYDMLYYLAASSVQAASSAQAAPRPLVWWLISWAVRLVALTGCGVLLQRVAAPGRTAFFLILLGIGLAYAIVSSAVESSLYLEKSRAALEAAFAQYAEQLKAAGSTLTVDSLLPIARAVSMIVKMIGLTIAATISFFVSLGISHAMAKRREAAVAAGAAAPAGAEPVPGTEPGAAPATEAASATGAAPGTASGAAAAPGSSGSTAPQDPKPPTK